MSFDPYCLTPAASLNRLKVVDVLGMNLPPEVKGKTGYELVSAHALCEMIREYADVLKLPADVLADERELPLHLDPCFDSAELRIQGAAYQIQRRFVGNLYYLLFVLKRDGPEARANRSDWDDSYWDYWAKINHVWLGGGLMSGNFGRKLDGYYRLFNRRAHPFEIRVDSRGAALPLIGAARHVPPGSTRALAFDFGSSFIKRAAAIYEDEHGRLAELRRLPDVPSQHTGEGETRALFDFMAATIADTYQTIVSEGASDPFSPLIPVSLAAYIDVDGQPYERPGSSYSYLRILSSSAERLLSDAVSERLGRAVTVKLLHDGTAAATAHHSDGHTAVIMMGTAMGIGFPPLADGLRPVADTPRIV